ncbi:MAG TPA: hypothetical protein VGA67_06165 [Candidatus Dojkabacteria bacterium]
MTIDNKLTFSELEIQKLFGHEAAEDEDPKRLREYYFKGNIYEQIASNLPLRILVGHKGIGKSALFQVAMLEEDEQDKINILIRPDDVLSLGTDTSDFLKTIREWKDGLSELIARKILTKVGANDESLKSTFQQYGGAIIGFLEDTFKGNTTISTAPAKKALIEQFLKKKNVSVYIDDLDRGWQGRIKDINRISALLNAIRDISTSSRGINFRVSLRSDVYYLVRTSDESTDKIEGSVIWHSWTNHEIFVLLIKRIESYFGRSIDEKTFLRMAQYQLANYLKPVIEDRFSGRGHWENAPMYQVLMSLIRKRPRDLVKLLTLSARNARIANDTLIRTNHLEDSFEEYSQGRLQDTINEFRSELPELERLLLGMKPSKKEKTTKQSYVYTTDALLKKINDIREQGEFRLMNNDIADSKRLAAFMFKINFLTARKETQKGLMRKYFEENRYLSNNFVDFGFDWEIHPAYRWALQPDMIFDIYNHLKLSVDNAD